ncbi:pyridoxal 5'-phosphate synthase glutaminase subunit PdxT [Guptibacillus algicola]|uniref:pyridoxal 5'-phosphate synthase glutaminase subunit PdxT n=1 Tax=Guptibacillus algicola TaxID=225844 RepID=UPI001CD452AD|nr:pyridoxal 5'-phosphate synthase glutaminase subunit PdxT [Alkalihalobacillus algicola]MCA0989635.1 pyridoxal 5'-phosphate synthase glutaminase subunit PdxT [Alkalihalobacillus algicola]
MVKVGVLGLQGAIREHVKALQTKEAEIVVVKRIEQLDDLDGLVLPGGESTTMRRLINQYGFLEPLKAFAAEKPIFGTCAGLILLAERIDGMADSHIGVMDVTAKRNAFGRQRESFEAPLTVEGLDEDFIGVFIRAPYIEEVGEGVEVLATFNDKIVAARDGRFLACAYHPELTDDDRMHQLFIDMVLDFKKEGLATE